MNNKHDIGSPIRSDSKNPYKASKFSNNQRKALVNNLKVTVPSINLNEVTHTDASDNGLAFPPSESRINRRSLVKNGTSANKNTKIFITEATPMVTENLPTFEDQTGRVETETNELLTSKSKTIQVTPDHSAKRKRAEIQTRKQSNSGDKVLRRQTWFSFRAWNPFVKDTFPKNKVHPGMGDELYDKRNDSGCERARKNWARARYLWNLTKATGAISATLNDRDAKIFRGRTAHHSKRKNTKWIRVKQWYINPNSSEYIIWQSVFQILLIYYIIVNPYLIVFRIEEKSFQISNYVIDGFYIIDIILRFFVAFKNPQTGDLIGNKKRIASNYLRGTLIPDILSLLPFDLIDRGLLFVRFVRCIRLMLTFQFVQLVCEKVTNLLVDGYNSTKISRFISRLIIIIFFLIVVSHFGACLWIEMGHPTDPNEETWFQNSQGYRRGYSPREFYGGTYTLYIESLLQVTTTLTTVGFGSYIGYTVREYILAMAYCFFGIFWFGYLISELKVTVQGFEEVLFKQTEKMKAIEEWLYDIERMIVNLRGVLDYKLLSKVKMILKFQNKDDIPDLFLNNSFFQALPFKEKEKLIKISFAHLKEFFHVLFSHLSEPFVNELLIQGEPICFLPSETIIKKGKYPLGVYLIFEGQICITGGPLQKSFRKLYEGSFFGESCLMVDHCSLYSYITKTATRCFFIKKEVFQELTGKYPADLKKIIALSHFRARYFRYARKQKENMTGEEDIEYYLEKVPQRKSSFVSRNSENSFQKNTGNDESKDQSIDQEKVKKSASFGPNKNNELLSIPVRNPDFRPRTLPPVANKGLDGISQMNSRKTSMNPNESEVETILSEDSIDSVEPQTEDEDALSENSELNYSDVFPVESFEHMFQGPSGGEQLLYFLEEQIEFYEQKLETVQRQVRMEIDVYTKTLNNKIKETFEEVSS